MVSSAARSVVPAVLAVLAVAACVEHSARPEPATVLELDLDQIHDAGNYPGITAAAVFADGRVVTAASGYADLESGTPMTPASRMLAASIGKTFVAATVVSLAAERRLDLDRPIADWLGNRDWFDRLPNARSITVRHLLSHRSGIPDHVHMPAFAEAWADGPSLLSPEALIGFVLDRPPLFAAGNGWAYSDTGYLLLGLLIEAVTGQSYESEVRSRFLVPLGLRDTGPSNTIDIEGLATGYVAADSGLGLPQRTTDAEGKMLWNPGIEWTGGGLYSTSRDLALWGRALFGGAAIPVRRLETMIAGMPTSGDDPDYRYGLGVAIWTATPWGVSYGHRGWIPGYVSSLRYYPNYGVAIAFQINTDIGILGEERPIVMEIENRLAALLLTGEVLHQPSAEASE